MNSVYALVDPRTKRMRYIGVAVDVHKRFAAHLLFEQNNDAKEAWLADLKSVGLLPSLKIIESNIADDLKFVREKYWILHYRSQGMPLTNQTHVQFPPRKSDSGTVKLGSWITVKRAAAILTERSGHTVSAAYVRLLGLEGKLEFKEIDGRTKLYSQADVEAYTVKQRGTGEIRRAARMPRGMQGSTQ